MLVDFSEEKKTLGIPTVHRSSEGWGPRGSPLPAQFVDLPYAPFGKSDRVGKCADFSSGGYYSSYANMRYRRRGEAEEVTATNAEFQYKFDANEDASFHLVDSAKPMTKKNWGPRRPWQNMRASRVPQRYEDRKGAGGRGDPGGRRGGGQQGGRGGAWHQGSRRGGGKHDYRRGWGGRREYRSRIEREASVAIKADWKVLEEFDIQQLTKLAMNRPKISDLLWCGHLDKYNDVYDRVTSKQSVKLQRDEFKEFYYVTTTVDPVIERLAVERKGNVFATDAILAHLMACPRSIYPWDIVVEKVNGILFFDKRDDSKFDFLTVNETAYDPPQANADDPDNINSPDKLSVEASMINQNFSQQILSSTPEERKVMKAPNPFFDPDEAEEKKSPASMAYRYRCAQLSEDTSLVYRSELHGYAIKSGGDQYMTSYSLNEWDSKVSGGASEWRQKIDSHRGAILATELKNNACKLAKWTAQSLIAGADLMKLGFVSRLSRTNPYDHVILATQFYKPKDFASQIAMQETTMWAIIKMLVDLLRKYDDGKFVILRDPNKALIRVYSVPISEFESSDEDEEEEEEEEEQGEGQEQERGGKGEN